MSYYITLKAPHDEGADPCVDDVINKRRSISTLLH